MKTNQIMFRKQGFIQRTKDKYFRATDLINVWNNELKKDEIHKYMVEYLKIKGTRDYVKYLQATGVKEPIIVSRKGTWVHPEIFIDLAMWVSLEFKHQVIQYVLDRLIETRTEAGDYYLQMCASIQIRHSEYYGKKASPMIFVKEARFIKNLLNIRIDRNHLSEKELNNLVVLQRINAELIDKGTGLNARHRQLEIIANALFR